MIEFLEIELKSLCGKRVLDAVDTYVDKVNYSWHHGEAFEDANAIRFRLDGAIYTAVENPEDGYRSSMDRFFVTLDCKMINVFPPVEVLVRMKASDTYQTNNTLEFIDTTTGNVVLEVGTDNTDDYYPSFVAAFHPENMITNNDKAPKTKAG